MLEMGRLEEFNRYAFYELNSIGTILSRFSTLFTRLPFHINRVCMFEIALIGYAYFLCCVETTSSKKIEILLK